MNRRQIKIIGYFCLLPSAFCFLVSAFCFLVSALVGDQRKSIQLIKLHSPSRVMRILGVSSQEHWRLLFVTLFCAQ